MSERVVDGELEGLTIERVCAAMEWRLYRIRRWIVQHKLERRLNKVQRVISATGPSHYYDSEELFEKLQREYPPRGPYGYDAHSAWCRASKRVDSILSIPELRERGKAILEVATGDGMTGRLLSDFGHQVMLCDIEDWRDDRARDLGFEKCDVCETIPFGDASFDFVYSYNAFEHLANPSSAFCELERVCRPGGMILLSFGPLYCSPWGLHAYRALRMPYPQFLFSRSFVDDKISQLGIYDLGRMMYSLQPLNRWRISQFRELWRNGSCVVLRECINEDVSHLDLILRYPDAFRGRDLVVEDLVTQGVRVLLRKNKR